MSLTNLRYALRNLRLAPGFALAAIGSIALGIAGNVTVFSLVNAILLKPLPYPEANRLVAISSVLPSGVDLGVLGIHILRWRSEVESSSRSREYTPHSRTHEIWMGRAILKELGPCESRRVSSINSGSSRNWDGGSLDRKSSLGKRT